MLWCVLPWWPGERACRLAAEPSADGTSPAAALGRSRRTTPLSPTWVLRKIRPRSRRLCTHLGMVVSAWLGAWLKVVWDGPRIQLARLPATISSLLLGGNLMQGPQRIRHQHGIVVMRSESKGPRREKRGKRKGATRFHHRTRHQICPEEGNLRCRPVLQTDC